MEEDMDSLFEGMVLFTPSQLGDEQKQHNPRQQDDPPLNNSAPESQSPFDASASTTKTILSDINTDPTSEPLDDNLFSDLTLQTLTPPSDPLPSFSRQISRKKKKASALRIGYGRDASPTHLPPHLRYRALEDTIPQHHVTQSNGDAAELDTPISDPKPSSSQDKLLNSVSAELHPSISDSKPLSAKHDVTAELDTSISESKPSSSKDDVPELDAITDSKPSSSSKEDQFEHIKAQISEKLQRSHQSAASVSAARKDAIRRKRNAADQLNSASAKHQDLELQLEAACEAEDFEAAERISESLASADKERQALLAALKDAETLCDTIDSEMHRVLNSQILAEQECATLLSNFAKGAEDKANSILKEARDLSSKEMDVWFSSSEALEAKKMELDIQSHFINEACLVVNDSIEHSIEDYRNEQHILHLKRDILNDEFQKLLALVREKEKEMAENDVKIKAVEEKIADVVSSFQDNQSSIDAMYHSLQSELSQMHLQNEALLTNRKEIDNFLAKEEGHAAKLREVARVSEEESKAYQEVVELRNSLMDSILKSMEDKVRLAKIEEKLIQDVKMLQQEVSSTRASLQELTSSKSNIQQKIASLKQRIFFIDKRVPELEAEKKVAAAARNFKEASRIAAEAKSLSVEKDCVQIDLEKATSEMDKLEEDIKNTINRLQGTEQLISSKEKEVAMARFQRLLLIVGSATAERSASLELGDTEEAGLLLAAAEAASAEARKLQSIYDLMVEDVSCLPRQFLSMELVSSLGRKQLAELAESINVSASQ